MTVRVGVDVGGTTTRLVVVDDHVKVLATLCRETPGRGSLVSAISSGIAELTAAQVEPVASVGVGVPGLVDPALGTVRHVANLGIGGEALALGSALQEVVGAPTAVENDANAAALGAWRLSAPGGSLAYLSIGTGISAGFVLGGEIWHGDRGVAGEIGHVQVEPGGRLCACGQRGCLEVVASGRAISQQWTGGRPAAVTLFDAADSGDPAAIELRDRVVSLWARTIHMLVLTIDPAHIVIGGGVAEVGAPLLDALTGALAGIGNASSFHQALDLPARVRLASPSVLVGAVGAALVGAAAAP